MRKKLIIFLLIGLSGGSIPGISAETGKIIDTVVCKGDASQSYALYVPAGCAGHASPVVYFFDPHGDGGHPLRKYKALADAYGFVLAGSNNSKNGNDWPATDRIWRSVFEDTQQRGLVDKRRIYTCGFSGGAKVAGYVAIQYPVVRGVILGGAGLPDGVSAGDLSFSLTMLAGEGDMNMTDLAALNTALDGTRTRHRILFFDGIHEWAPVSVMGEAFGGWQLDVMREGILPGNMEVVGRLSAESKGRVSVYTGAGRLIRAWQECRYWAAVLAGVSADAGWFEKKGAAIAGSADYREQLRMQERLLSMERNRKNEFMPYFQQGDAHYWSGVIGDLRAKAGAKTAEGGMNQRLLAYLSLAFYSLSNRMLNAGDNGTARHFVELYKMADPDNSEAWYFSAVLDAREGHIQAVGEDLMKAVGMGFRDIRRLRQQPEFQRLAPATIKHVESRIRGLS